MKNKKPGINWPFVRVFVIAAGSWIIAASAFFSIGEYDTSLGIPVPLINPASINGIVFLIAGGVSVFAGIHWMNVYGPFLEFRYEYDYRIDNGKQKGNELT